MMAAGAGLRPLDTVRVSGCACVRSRTRAGGLVLLTCAFDAGGLVLLLAGCFLTMQFKSQAPFV